MAQLRKKVKPKKKYNTANKRDDALLAHCEKFIRDQQITCSEAVHQTDRVIENAYEFIEGVCEIVGYHQTEDDEDA